MSSRTNKAALGISAKPAVTQRLSTNSQWYMGTPGHSRPQPALTAHSLKLLSLLTHLDYSSALQLLLLTILFKSALTATAALNLTGTEWIE